MGTRTAVELAQAYLAAVQAKDKPALLALFGDGFVAEVPYNLSGTNDPAETRHGLEQTAAGYQMAFELIDVLRYVDVEITASSDPNTAFAEMVGDMTMTSGRPYRNRYIFRFDAADGKLSRLREYCSPITTALAWDLPLPRPEPARNG